jgi:hypothetical protein
MSRYIDRCKDCIHYQMCHSVNIDAPCASYKNKADVVEVVRCKDCAHWGGVTYGFVCRKFSGLETKICMGADHYCSFGERKEK